MDDLWKHRTKPTPLNVDQLKQHLKHTPTFSSTIDRDQNIWNVATAFCIFSQSSKILARRLEQGKKNTPDFYISFDKDDDDVMDFVTAAANLRSYIFGIEPQTRFKAKGEPSHVDLL
jgi:ubiquitin-like 1-activating enzyme E1 B